MWRPSPGGIPVRAKDQGICSRSADGTSLAIGVGARVLRTPLWKARMTGRTIGFREGFMSAAVFGAILFALVSVDPRVEQQMTDLVRGGASVASWGDKLGDLGGALLSAARDHSIDNAPLLVFATVGTVLTLFMLKS
jgi:hypothetical protein